MTEILFARKDLIGTGAALTAVNDTNVTAALSGSPTLALVAATTITFGWTGTLAVSRGGSGAGTFTANGVLLGNGTAAFGVTAVGTNGQLLLGQTAAAPTWNTLSGDATITNTGVLTVAASAITNAKQANMAAWTLKMNNTSGAAAPQDVTIDGLTLKASPVGADEIPIWDVAGAGMKKATITAALAAGGVSSINGQTGALTLYTDPGGRLTLSTGVPVMTATVSGANTVYYTPYTNSFIMLYNGTNWLWFTFAEVSQLTTDTTKSPAAVVANSNYDMFVWNDAGTLRCTRGPAWTSNTARGSGAGTTQLARQNGIWTNAVAITNGPAANQGRYVGTIRSNGSSLVDWIINPAAAAGGNNSTLGVWNAYNRVQAGTQSSDSTASWTYATSTWRAANGNANNAINFIDGLQLSHIDATYTVLGTGGASNGALIGVNLDSTSATPTAQGVAGWNSQTASSSARQIFPPQLGFHTVNAVESVTNSTSATFNGSAIATGAGQTQFLTASLMM